MRVGGNLRHFIRGKYLDFAGRFPYFGATLYFPRHSVGFLAAWDQGIFEAENVRILQALARSDAWVFDIGANIGLMSVPILFAQAHARVLAFEPSPNNIPYLSRSISEGPYHERWSLVPKAAGAQAGCVRFALASPENSMFDGLHSTGLVAAIDQIEVEMTTIDAEWERLGEPAVSAIKCDVEGAEMQVLAGATKCIRARRPAILLEWNAHNLVLYGTAAGTLLQFADNADYRVYSIPRLVQIATDAELEIHMAFSEYFLLLPL
jgi:FkbM family methyltransferase